MQNMNWQWVWDHVIVPGGIIFGFFWGIVGFIKAFGYLRRPYFFYRHWQTEKELRRVEESLQRSLLYINNPTALIAMAAFTIIGFAVALICFGAAIAITWWYFRPYDAAAVFDV